MPLPLGQNLNVDILATTLLADYTLREAYAYDAWKMGEVTEADALAEAAGRLCYKSFHRPNPATADNRDYLARIISQDHLSVTEHASVTFLVREVSRALLTELTRHRHLSFSVVSQRYVDYSQTEPVIPPAILEDSAAFPTDGETVSMSDIVRNAYAGALNTYAHLVDVLTDSGLSRKKAREAARAILPNAAPVDMVVTGNFRAWRDVLAKRWHVAADAEIREFAGLVLGHVRELAPSTFQDIPADPYGS